MYVFCGDLRTKSDYFPIQNQLTGFYKRDGVFTVRYDLSLYAKFRLVLIADAVEKAIDNTYSKCVTNQRNISYHTVVFPGSPGHGAVRCRSHGGRCLAEGDIRNSGQLLAGIPRPCAGWNSAGVHIGGACPAGCCVVRSKPGVYSLRPGSNRQPGDR